MRYGYSIPNVKADPMAVRKVRLLYSPDPDQLVRAVFKELSDHHSQWPDQRAFILVPEYMKADMERRYLTDQAAGGLMMAEVLSFNRLASRLADEVGRQAVPVISTAGKAVLAQKALLDDNLPFNRFHRLAGKPRYALELVSILGDFNRYRITAGDLRASKEEPASSRARQATREKLEDFALLKESLDEEMRARGLEDPDQKLSRLAELLNTRPLPERLAFLERARIWVLGFGNDRDFTSQEGLVLEALAKLTPALTLAVAADSLNSEGEPAYRLGRETLQALGRIFPDAERTRLAAKASQAPPEIHFIRSINRREEARYTAGEIRRLLLTGNLRRREIAVALSESEEIATYLESAFEDYGIQAYIDTGRPLRNSSFIRLLSSFLKLCHYDFTLPDLLDYYKSGLAARSGDPVDRFENAALALDWRKAADLREITGSPEARQSAVAAYVDPGTGEGRDLLSVLEDVKDLLDTASSLRGLRSGQAKCDFLLDFLLGEMNGEGGQFPENSPAGRVFYRRDDLLDQGREENARLLVSSWNAVIDFLQEASALLGSARISQAHFTALILAGLEGLSLSSIPAGIDRVRVGSLSQMAVWPCKLLFVLGMTDTAFPPEMKGEGYLLDDERIYLSERTGKAFPNRRQDQPAAQAWLVNSLLTRPSQALYLSTPTLGGNSSRIYDDWLASEGGQEIILAGYGDEPDPRWYAPKMALRLLRGKQGAPEAWREALASLRKEPPRLLPSADLIAESLVLPRTRVEPLMKKRDSVSVSLLQSYNDCPFRFFIQYLTGASERRVAQDQPNLQGTLLHRLLELASRELKGELEAATTPGEIRALVLEWQEELTPFHLRPHYDRATRNPYLALYAKPGLAGGVGDRLIRRAVDTLSSLSEFNLTEAFVPLELEWTFPSTGRPAYRLSADGHAFTCRGSVDRIDARPDGALRIIDYKRSMKEFSWTGLYDGTDLQLPLYKRAYETAFPGSLVTALLFAGWRTSSQYELSSYRPLPDDGRKEALKSLDKQLGEWQGRAVDQAAAFAEKRAARTLESIMEGRFPARPAIRGRRDPCQFCPWHAACGYDKRLARNSPLPETAADRKAIRGLILQDDGAGGRMNGQGSEGEGQGFSSI